MFKQFIRQLAAMELEEKILNAGSFVGFIGVFLPWVSGNAVTYAGYSYFTGFIGLTIAVLHIFVLLITFSPMLGGPSLIRKDRKDLARFAASAQTAILVLAALSVITKTTLDFTSLEIRFGIYLTLIGSLVAALYTFMLFQENQKREVQALFHHPVEPVDEPVNTTDTDYGPRMTPPKQSEPEEHKLYSPQLRK